MWPAITIPANVKMHRSHLFSRWLLAVKCGDATIGRGQNAKLGRHKALSPSFAGVIQLLSSLSRSRGSPCYFIYNECRHANLYYNNYNLWWWGDMTFHIIICRSGHIFKALLLLIFHSSLAGAASNVAWSNVKPQMTLGWHNSQRPPMKYL